MTAFYVLDEYDLTYSTYVVRGCTDSDYYDTDISVWLVPGTFSLES